MDPLLFSFLLGVLHRSGISGSYTDSLFDILRNCQAVFQNGGTVSHFHQQCWKVPGSPLVVCLSDSVNAVMAALSAHQTLTPFTSSIL